MLASVLEYFQAVLEFVLMLLYSLAILGLSLFGLHRYFILFLYLTHRKGPKTPKKFKTLPFVTVQLPMFNESMVVRRLLNSVEKLDYPKDRLEIQILDDSTDETRIITQAETERLKLAGFQVSLIQREDRRGYKAGALAQGLKTAKGELVYILDADFVPPADAIMKLVHYFSDPQVGMVQTRWGHLNRDYSILTRVQSIFLDAHFVLEQSARSRSGRFFHFNGTAGMWRKSTIDDAGGWEEDTLTEDMDLSLRAQLKGWRFIYLEDVVTPAELPVEMRAFKTQQHRWTKGGIQSCKKLLGRVWKSNASIRAKVEATVQLTCPFVYLMIAFLCVMHFPINRLNWGWDWPWYTEMTMFLMTTLSGILFYLFSARRLYPESWLKDLLHVPMLLATGIGICVNNSRAIFEALLNRQSEFVRTPKSGIETAPKTKTSSVLLVQNQAVKRPKSRSKFTFTGFLETIMALYFSVVTAYAVMDHNWGSVPFILLFVLGFSFVAWPTRTKPESKKVVQHEFA